MAFYFRSIDVNRDVHFHSLIEYFTNAFRSTQCGNNLSIEVTKATNRCANDRCITDKGNQLTNSHRMVLYHLSPIPQDEENHTKQYHNNKRSKGSTILCKLK